MNNFCRIHPQPRVNKWPNDFSALPITKPTTPSLKESEQSGLRTSHFCITPTKTDLCCIRQSLGHSRDQFTCYTENIRLCN